MLDLYKKRLIRNEIELCFVENCTSFKDILEWIKSNDVKCMMVDYDLTEMYDFNGTQLVAYLNSIMPDLPCIILSNYCETGKAQNLVIENLFVERDDLSADATSERFINLIKSLKQAVNVFDNRLQLNLTEYTTLKEKKDNGEINAEDEERFVELYKILRSYNEVDEIPAELLTSNTTKKMTDILSSLNKLLDDKK